MDFVWLLYMSDFFITANTYSMLIHSQIGYNKNNIQASRAIVRKLYVPNCISHKPEGLTFLLFVIVFT